ncbi:helix-turn-helix domain-containing protein [Flavonifractor porci]|uniref:helix-turn-helix domain-containing protein n=1 Tax=Flavonifractor porci TaxID=3133422 RepID=UPI00309D88A8
MWAISTTEGRRVKFYEINGKRNLCGDRIREARQKKRLSQSDLSKLLQLRGIMVERDVISRMESGARIVTDFEAVAIAEALEVPVLWLLDKE